MTDVITSVMQNIVPIILGMLSAAVISAGIWFANKYQPNTQVDYKMVASYMIVGGIIGAVETYLGLGITMESMGVLILANMGFITAVDVVLSGIFKSPTATFVMKYTGHTYYPIFRVTQNDGTVTAYNDVGRCCSVTVFRAATLAQQASRAISEVVASWSTGFTVTPAFTEGYSPVSVTFKVKMGRNSDTSEIKTCDIDFADGTTGTIPLALDNEGTSAGSIDHVYVFT